MHRDDRSDSPCRKGGFTLIEIMIAVAIIAILAAIAIPSYEFAVRKARRAEARTALMQLMQLEERYFSVRNTYIAFNRAAILSAAPDADLQRFKWYSGDTPEGSHYQIRATACGAGAVATCVALRADPGTPNVQYFVDPGCGSYVLQSDGKRFLIGAATPELCW
jgi:type IV pilus assembly protein PilE